MTQDSTRKNKMVLNNYEKDVYICHGDKDQRYVEHLCKRFDEQGISYGYSSQKYGEKIPSELIETIRNCRIILFVATHNSYQSPFAVKELVYAFNNIDTSRIIIYQADDAKLPDSIKFISQKDNIIQSNHHYVSEAIMQRVCGLLEREMRPFDETEDDESVYESHTFLSLLLMFGFPLLGIALSVGVGLWRHSILLGSSVLLGAAGVYMTALVSTVSDFAFKTPVGKLTSILRYLLCILMSSMIPVSTWIGIENDSWRTGLLWFGIAWTILIALLVLVYKAESAFSVSKIPLSNQHKTDAHYDFFLCFDHSDNLIVDRIKTELRRNGMTYITSDETTVEEGVDCSCGFLYVGSKHCYGNDCCNKELVYGFNHRRPILAYAIDQAEMPEDIKLAFSNSNIRTIATHPIETSLMGDLKDILNAVQSQHTVRVDDSFWHTLFLVFSTVFAIVAAVGAGLWLHSVAVAVTILFGALMSLGFIDDNSEQRKNVTQQTGKDVTLLEALLLISTPVLPVVAWWLFVPGPWLSALFIILYLALYGCLAEFVGKLVKSNPAGCLSPSQVDDYYDVFISYSRRNTPVADDICRLLEKEKVSYFIDRQGIPGGSEFPAVLAIAIKNCGIFLCLLSEDSLASKFCQQEKQYAEQHKLDNDILLLFLNEGTEKEFLELVGTQETARDFEKISYSGMSDEWKRQLMERLKRKLPESQQYQMHQVQVGGHSIIGDFRHSAIDYIKKNPITSIVTTVLVISSLLGLSFHSFIVALGAYSFLIPLPILWVTRDFTKSLIESLQIIAFSVWLGLINHSVWMGVAGGAGILLVYIIGEMITNKTSAHPRAR